MRLSKVTHSTRIRPCGYTQKWQKSDKYIHFLKYDELLQVPDLETVRDSDAFTQVKRSEYFFQHWCDD